MKESQDLQFEHIEKDIERLKSRMDKGEDRDRENERILGDLQSRVSVLRSNFKHMEKTMDDNRKTDLLRVGKVEANIRYVVLAFIGGMISSFVAMFFK